MYVTCATCVTSFRKRNCEYHRENPSMSEIIHIHANTRVRFSYPRMHVRVYVPAKISFHGTHVTGDNFDIVIDMLMHVLSNITLHS